MKTARLIVVALALLAMPVLAENDTASDRVGDEAPLSPPSTPGPIWNGPGGAVLVDNGPLISSVGTGIGGEDESILQNVSLGMNTLGFAHQVVSDNRITDDFTVTGDEGWILEECTFFAYQTGSPLTSTMTALNLRILDAAPPGGTVVFGDTTTDVLASTSFTNILRVTETTTGIANNRPIMAQTVDMGGLTLAPGTYWFDWQTDGTLTSGPWAPPITTVGVANTGNGLQSFDGGLTYGSANDSGTATPQQGFPFVCTGQVIQTNVLEVPTLNQLGLLAFLLLLGGFGIVRMQRA